MGVFQKIFLMSLLASAPALAVSDYADKTCLHYLSIRTISAQVRKKIHEKLSTGKYLELYGELEESNGPSEYSIFAREDYERQVTEIESRRALPPSKDEPAKPLKKELLHLSALELMAVNVSSYQYAVENKDWMFLLGDEGEVLFHGTVNFGLVRLTKLDAAGTPADVFVPNGLNVDVWLDSIEKHRKIILLKPSQQLHRDLDSKSDVDPPLDSAIPAFSPN